MVKVKVGIRQIIGDNIRCLRYRAGWSQETLGEKTGLHQDYIGRLERGTENIGVDNLANIALVFKVAPYNLLMERFCNGNVLLDGHKDGHKLDGHKLDGHKLDGHKLDGHKLDGQKDGQKLDGHADGRKKKSK